ncbi:HAD family hydrolase [Nocardioides maradonensis]
MRPTYVLFDLDGTLTDSAEPILSSLAHAFGVHGIAPLAPAAARALLGPPFYESLPPLIGEELVLPVIASYRERYTTAMLDAPVYAGIPALLEQLGADGVTLAVASSKPEVHVREILTHHGLADLFATMGGDELDGSLGTKALVIDRVLERLGRPDPATVLMVGDRLHDVHGARTHGIDCVGVRWGYALDGELEHAGASSIVTTTEELAAALA